MDRQDNDMLGVKALTQVTDITTVALGRGGGGAESERTAGPLLRSHPTHGSKIQIFGETMGKTPGLFIRLYIFIRQLAKCVFCGS